MNEPIRRSKISYSCDPLLFRQLRERQGWTQATLTEKSGYSLRVISKLESCESVSPQALEEVAEALSLPSQGVAVEDLISNPVGLAKQYFAAMYTQQGNMFDAIKHFLDDNVVFNIPGDQALIPFAGIYHGPEGFRDLCQKFFACLEVPAGHNHLPHYSLRDEWNRRDRLGKELYSSDWPALRTADATVSPHAIQPGKVDSA